MLGTALVVFREVLEAALVIGIACAATRGVRGRAAWVTAGIGAGVLGACLVAGFADVIANAVSGMGQEVFNAGVLFAAVGMLGWHNVWMARHGREMAQEMTQVGDSVRSGARPLYALGLVVALAVLREGSEVVLFLYGLSAGGTTHAGLWLGGAIGLAGGAAMGVLLYFGLLRIPMRHFFRVTGWMILLLAAGMASQAAGFLIQADLLPALGNRIWDSSWLVSSQSVAGKALATLIGYDDHPAGAQLLFYLVTLVTIGILMKLFGRPAPARAAVALLAACAALPFAAPQRAEAGEVEPSAKVYLPTVELGETEIELRGGYLHDHRGDVNTDQTHLLEVGHGFTPWWFTELVGAYDKEPNNVAKLAAIEWENIFQITNPGEHFVDLGFFLEAEFPTHDHEPVALEGGPILQKQIGRSVNTLDLFAEHHYGENAETKTDWQYRFESRYLMHGPVDLGLQAYGSEKVNTAGPALFGKIGLGGRKAIKYEAAAVAGLTKESPDLLLRYQLEYEF